MIGVKVKLCFHLAEASKVFASRVKKAQFYFPALPLLLDFPLGDGYIFGRDKLPILPARSYVWASPSNNSRLPFWKWKWEKAMSPKLLGTCSVASASSSWASSKLHGGSLHHHYYRRLVESKKSRKISLWVPKHTVSTFWAKPTRESDANLVMHSFCSTFS